MSNIITPDFLILPYLLVEDDRLTDRDRRVYSVIYWYVRQKGEKCQADNETIARIAKVAKGGIANSLSALEKYGYVKKCYSGAGDIKNKREEIIPLVFFGKITEEKEQKEPRGLHTAVKGASHSREAANIYNIDISKNYKIDYPEKDIKKQKTDDVNSKEKYNFPDYLKEMLNDSRSHIRFLARFFKYRKLSYSSKNAAIEAISRFSRIASKLVKTYSDDELQWAAKYCKNAYPDIQWTPETMLKALVSCNRKSDGTKEAAAFGKTKFVDKKQKSTKYDHLSTKITE